MCLPKTCDFDLFAFRNREDHTDDGHTRGAVNLDARNRVVRIGMLVSDSADGPLQRGLFVAFFYHSGLQAPSYCKGTKIVNPRPNI